MLWQAGGRGSSGVRLRPCSLCAFSSGIWEQGVEALCLKQRKNAEFLSLIVAKSHPSLLVPSIHDSSWILAASSFAFPKMLPELTLLWLLLDESGKGQKWLFPLEHEGAGTGKVGVRKWPSPGPSVAKSPGSWSSPRRLGEQTALLHGMAPGSWRGNSLGWIFCRASAPASLALFHS